jgi:crotonobetainyl-CoA:carnitine CoA-transferase CaiB-like acyl-CoA transferase
MKIDNQPKRYDVPRLPSILNKIVLPVIRKWSKKSGLDRQEKLLNLARKSYPAMMTSYRCRDGKLLYIFAIDNAKLSITLLLTLGLYEKALAEGLVNMDPYQSGDLSNNLAETSNLSRSLQNRIKSMMEERFLQEDSSVWEKILSEKGLTYAVQGTTKEWLNNPQLLGAGILTSIDDPILGSTIQPGVQTFLTDTPKENITPKPRIFNDEYLATQWEKSSGANPRKVSGNSTLSSPSQWLAGVTVIELCSMVAGPISGRTLAEYGAKVIKIETPEPNHGPRLTCWYGIDVNQGKNSVLLDLKTEKGRNAFNQILASGDILLSNLSKKAEKDLGFSERSISEINDELIFARLNAFNGPIESSLSQRTAYDPVLQAMSGIMMRYGDEKNPELHAIASCVDALTGYSHAFGVALALYKKQSRNTISRVDTCLATAATLVQLPYGFTYKDRVWEEPNGQHCKGEHALYRIYATRDSWIFIAANSSKVSDLPDTIISQSEQDDDHDITKKLIESFKSMSTIRALKLLQNLNIAVLEIQDINTLRKKWERSNEQSILKTQHVEGLGKVSTIVSHQVKVNDQKLQSLTPSEKVGGSTQILLKQFGIDADNLIAERIAATELNSSYLP